MRTYVRGDRVLSCLSRIVPQLPRYGLCCDTSPKALKGSHGICAEEADEARRRVRFGDGTITGHPTHITAKP
jgi:hypothetical protein